MTIIGICLDAHVHEPLHDEEEMLERKGPDDAWALMRITFGAHMKGPSGNVSVCKHCMLLYFTPDE